MIEIVWSELHEILSFLKKKNKGGGEEKTKTFFENTFDKALAPFWKWLC